jgi:hypothetical protein
MYTAAVAAAMTADALPLSIVELQATSGFYLGGFSCKQIHIRTGVVPQAAWKFHAVPHSAFHAAVGMCGFVWM